MPNHTRTRADGVWVDGYTPPPADYQDLERKVFKSWNGDRGGAYCPPQVGGSALVIGGSGLQVTGPTRLTYGGSILGGSSFIVRDGTWPALKAGHTGRLRSILQTIRTFQSPKAYLWTRNLPAGMVGVGSVALSCRSTYGRTVDTPELYIPLRVHDGSALKSVEFTFRVAIPRVYAPIAMPKFRVLRIPRDVNAEDPKPLRATADGLGFDSPPLLTSASAWYADGTAQTFQYVCNQNHVIDVENYHYLVHIIEERGHVTVDDPFDGIRLVERKADVVAVGLSSLTLSGDLNFDGNATGTGGSRFLVVDPDSVLETGTTVADSAKNGIWLSAAGAWSRAADLDEQLDFTPGFIVAATTGQVNASSVWQCEYPSSNTRVNLVGSASDSATQPRFRPAEPRGNIYHSVKPTFELSDLRFQ